MKIEPHDIPDLGPEVYAGWRSSTVGAITEALQSRLIMQMLGDVRGRRVLDVGCGDGTLAIELAKRGAIVTGIDLSGAMIEAAKASARRQAADVEFAVAPAERMPFSAEHFDIIAAVTILCFVEDAKPAFEEIARV